MIGSNSWASGESLSGGIALAVVPAALVSAAFLMGEPHRTGQETETGLGIDAAIAPGGTLACFS
ncbi:hypothetical protein WI61_16540 [Burkholderia cepacia]|uniref:hypothetical protein n=1 Tax=Burkholderia cepacia TaxID=292 RepID=UPI0007559460|nr:hypothetical protein [Burkholderia cepacia]KUY88675.1 hypothetical protein WI25_31515 [Burkholderia cepacia]KVA54954.1 hypothetical protein WI48_20715 [Burkholderia cepacia]KVA56030.1 hypothetical protein WI49_33920 [Burkholderia cepacia]KVA79329.1 hypothetical protein WI50_28695 [Burkholderia cepacia]KVA83315.1 hypothetical protein WI52_17535 [Burkholderia cepacia]